MALGIEDCVKLTRQASTDNERMAILLLIGTDFQTEKDIHGPKVCFRPTIEPSRFMDPCTGLKSIKKPNIQIRLNSMIQIQKNFWTVWDIHFVEN